MPFPEDGLVYDYSLDDGGISKFGADDDEIDETPSGSEVEFSFADFEVIQWLILSIYRIPFYLMIQ